VLKFIWKISFISLLAKALALSTPAAAQSVNNGAGPVLRSTLVEGNRRPPKPDDGVAQTVAVGVAIGHTNNAGPTLEPAGSPFFETSALVLNSRSTLSGTLTLQAEATTRAYSNGGEARDGAFELKGAYSADDESISLAASASQTVDIEEDVRVFSVSGKRAWAGATTSWTPFVRADLAYLDYADVNALFLEFANQDDRSRLSATAESGLQYKVSERVGVSAAIGANAKDYIAPVDDFLLSRDNASIYASIGAAYSSEKFQANLNYAPVFRSYREEFFGPLIVHTFHADLAAKPLTDVGLYAKARVGLEETDFLSARANEETVAIAGATLALPGKASTSTDAAYTGRRFHGIERRDRKYEIQWRAQAPLDENWKVTAQVGYLVFESEFGDLSLDQTTVMFGVIHTSN
jgi:hypothetical protein